MANRVTPLIRVADLGATLEWYTRVGFIVVSTHERDGEMDWAQLAFGEGRGR